MAEQVIELESWKGDWGLTSIDPNCLAVLAYCRFSGVPVKVKKSNNPLWSPSGDLPILKHNGLTQTKLNDIFSYLRKQNWGSDFSLSNKQSADVVAFTSMLEERLLPAVLHFWWIDSKTFSDLTRPWYSRVTPFPLNFFIPGRKQRRASSRVFLSKGGENVEDSEVESRIYREAKECINHLAYKLGENDYFFGKMPTSLDALVYGYLAPMLKAPLPNNPLQNHLKACTNLCNFCNRIQQRFFPPDPEEIEAKRKEESQRKNAVDDPDFPNRKRNMILAAIFATTAMIGYAFLCGLIQIELVDSDPRISGERTHGDMSHMGSPDEPMFDDDQEEGAE